MKLNLGSGKKLKEGFVNLDYYYGKADVNHDLSKFPYPFEDNTFEYVYSKHVIEHIWAPTIKIMDELIRICKDGAIMEISVPFYNTKGLGNFGHVRGFNFNGFKDFTQKRDYYYKNGDIIEVSRVSRPTKIGKLIPNFPVSDRFGFREYLSMFIGNLTFDITFKYLVQK